MMISAMARLPMRLHIRGWARALTGFLSMPVSRNWNGNRIAMVVRVLRRMAMETCCAARCRRRLRSSRSWLCGARFKASPTTTELSISMPRAKRKPTMVKILTAFPLAARPMTAKASEPGMARHTKRVRRILRKNRRRKKQGRNSPPDT